MPDGGPDTSLPWIPPQKSDFPDKFIYVDGSGKEEEVCLSNYDHSKNRYNKENEKIIKAIRSYLTSLLFELEYIIYLDEPVTKLYPKLANKAAFLASKYLFPDYLTRDLVMSIANEEG